MTTIAVRDGIMACDSRITGGFIMETQTKVIVGKDAIVGYCGTFVSGYIGAQWLAGELNDRPPVASEDDNEYIVLQRDGLYLADNQLRIAPIKGKFCATGSGCQAAMAAMLMGATAKQAVQIAIKCDESSGGPVKEFSFE